MNNNTELYVIVIVQTGVTSAWHMQIAMIRCFRNCFLTTENFVVCKFSYWEESGQYIFI